MRNLAILAFLSAVVCSAPLQAQTGYVVDAHDGGQAFEHTNNTKVWYAHGRWWCIAQDTSADDWFIYENDGPVPPVPGTAGGWTHTAVNVDIRNSARIDLWYNQAEDILHVLRIHNTGGTYNEYLWNGTLERWDLDLGLGDIALPAATRSAGPCLAVDSTGQAFVAHDGAGVITLEFSLNAGRTAWSSFTMASGTPNSTDNRTALVPFDDTVDGGQMGLGYFSDGTTLVFLRHDDDDGDLLTDWTSETVDTATEAEDHVCLRANGVTGDVFAVVKTEDDDVVFFKRPAGGVWGDKTELSVGQSLATRPQLAVEEDNDEVWVFWTDWVEDRIVYRRSPAGLIQFGGKAEALANPAGSGLDDVQLPKAGWTCSTGLLVTASTDAGTWYNPLAITWYRDTDGDGFGETADSVEACSPPMDYVAQLGDCDETDIDVNPGATEICDGGIDNDCDGEIDESGPTWYPDLDSDGYGDPDNGLAACTQPSGYLADSSDCDDSDASINPDGTEVCDDRDNNCDGNVDESGPDPRDWYRDLDSDGFGDVNDTLVACAQPAGYVLDSTDCDDTNDTIYPGAPEIPDGEDNDCNDIIDDLPEPSGYILDSESGQDLSHTNNTKVWFAHDRWWCIAQDTSSSDWFLYENDGPLPAPGTQGGWTQTGLNVDSLNSTRIDVWYNQAEDVAHLLRMHSTAGTYNELVWNVGPEEYTLDPVVGSVALPGATEEAVPCIAVDSTGQAFVSYDSGGTITVEYTTNPARDTWAGVTLATGAPLAAENRTALMPFNDSVDGAQMGLIFFSAAGTLAFRKHDDDAGNLGTDWIAETVDAATSSDDHACLRSHPDTGDLFAVVKSSAGSIVFYKRPDRGSWGDKTTLISGTNVATRPQIVVDRSNHEAYVFWTDWVEDRIVYRKTHTHQIAFGAEIQAIAKPFDNSFDDVQLPKQSVSWTTELLAVADGDDATWFNPIDITDQLRVSIENPGLVEWQGGDGFDSWNLYKGDLGVLRSTGVYTQQPGSNPLAERHCGLTSPMHPDAALPASGETVFFLVTGSAGPIENSLGRDGAGDERTNDNPCP